MKIRNGYVSNSSSSSFVLFGMPVNAKSLTEDMLNNKNYRVIGDNYEGGVDLFDLDNENLPFFKAVESLYGNENPFQIYEDFGEGEIDLSKLPKKGKAQVIGGEADQNSSYDIDSLFTNYCENREDGDNLDKKRIKREMNKYKRSDKIKKNRKKL